MHGSYVIHDFAYEEPQHGGMARGHCVGNRETVAALARIKGYLDLRRISADSDCVHYWVARDRLNRAGWPVSRREGRPDGKRLALGATVSGPSHWLL